ncbi:hypothetical protein CGLO_15154 [Colletotrichum gloeosporioides Cg-14]|uniref:Zn(2)-C6 fungal-type domain-containing protein n=1 Tax=Colletotrichum gloeosporioides (strain Cg-14) TaxID=1237896 RepID=T0LC73_COLGC|nr:hypothetical protein CGLO_15154 [Colletotrichum gloeosporioides Cg-14]
MTSTARRIALATAADHPAAGGGRKQCWECQRRRVVCDAVRPVCGKCKATGVVCPGYEDKKPLTWLAPGKVKTRTWKRKKPAAKKESSKTSSEQDSSPDSNKAVTRAGSQMVHIFPPSPGMELRSEVCDIIEATSYWNESVYPSFETTQLMKSPWIIPVRFIHYMPAATRHALVSMAIEHRMLRLSQKKTNPLMMEIRARFHHHRCLAIQALNDDVCNDATRGSDMTMASVMVFLYADLMGSATASNWRHHLNGYKSLVDMRGGFENVYRLTPYMAPMLLFPKIVETFANSTSPADDQSEPNHSYDNIDLIAELYQSGYYPFLPCPVDLFTDVIRINYLRYLIATDSLPEDMGTPQSASEDLIEDIIEFSPETWAETREADIREELLLMAQAYQSAIALYAISSLQGLRALPSSAGWRAVRTIHYGRLISLLEKAAEAPLMKNCVEWPLIVAGFEASTGSATGRVMVVKQLVSMSQDWGTYLPLAAVGVLEKFWSSGKRTWDDCFDEPYALFA